MTRLRGLFAHALTIFALVAPGVHAAEPVNLKAGLWRLSVEMIIPGRGPDTGPLTTDMCLKPSDVARLAAPPNSPCQISGLDIQPRRMRWKVSCAQGQMRSHGAGIMEFAGTSFSSALLIETEPPYAMRIKQSMLGSYLGPCPAHTPTGKAPLKPYTE